MRQKHPNYVNPNDYQRPLTELLHPDLRDWLIRVDANNDIAIIEAQRSLKRQEWLFKQGRTTIMNSRHLMHPDGYVYAVDFVPIVEKRPLWDWDFIRPIAKIAKSYADQMGLQIEWGGDWKKFPDGAHWQLPRREYPGN